MPVPSHRWFPRGLPLIAAWFVNFAEQFALVSSSLGFSNAKSIQVNEDRDVILLLNQANNEVEAYNDAIRLYRGIITEGDIGQPTPAFPDSPTLVLTQPVATGIYARLIKLVEQIEAADAYTDEIGALLGILPSAPTEIAPADLKPTLSPATEPDQFIEYRFTVGDTNGIKLEIQVDGGAWTSEGNFAKSPARIQITTGDASKPHQVNARARYFIGNNPVGQNSDIVAVVTIP